MAMRNGEKFLEPVINHPDLNIRTKLIFALSRLSGKDSVRILIKALADKDKTVCLHAIRVLGKIGDKTALEALEKYAKSPDALKETKDAIENIKKKINNNKTRSKNGIPET